MLGHWRHLADADSVAAYRWVAVRHEISYHAPGFLRDALVAAVWIERVRRESAFYRTDIRRGTSTLASIQSRWCCLDAAELRPARLPDAVVARFFT